VDSVFQRSPKLGPGQAQSGAHRHSRAATGIAGPGTRCHPTPRTARPGSPARPRDSSAKQIRKVGPQRQRRGRSRSLPAQEPKVPSLSPPAQGPRMWSSEPRPTTGCGVRKGLLGGLQRAGTWGRGSGFTSVRQVRWLREGPTQLAPPSLLGTRTPGRPPYPPAPSWGPLQARGASG
jgi:hypothetical protein